VRVLDAGGWSDTWFARHGAVCHLAVGPGAEAFARLSPISPGCEESGSGEVQLRVADFGDHYGFRLDRPPGRHPLLEATIRRWAPPGRSLEIATTSAVPAGSSLGTSASVVVALIAALQELTGPSAVTGPDGLAHGAHEVETVDLGRQSGVQDQVAAAYGGANLVRIAPYPSFDVQPLQLAPDVFDALARRVITVYLGAFHDSSAVHDTVIKHLAGNEAEADRLLTPLRDSAARAAIALAEGDLSAYGEAMIANTEAQAALHPTLVNPLARHTIAIADRCGALGWKVNGAGGTGGTVSLIAPDDPDRLLKELELVAQLQVLPLQPARQGAQVVDRS